MLDFRLRVFQSVARNLSFTKAASELYITQPAVTKHIKELESEFAVKLFDRVGNKIQLTPAGQIFQRYADSILALHNELNFELHQLSGTQKGNLRIGASTTISQYVIPPMLARFHERYPEVNLSLVSGNTEFIEQQLLNSQIDIGIVEGKPGNPDIRYVPFLNDELFVFASAQNRHIPASVSNDEFLKLPLVLRERGSGTLEIIERNLQLQHINPKQLNIQMFLGSTEAIKAYVKTGSGAGIVSRFAIAQELASDIFRRVETPGLQFDRQFYFVSPQGPEPTGLAKLFLQFLQK